MDQSDECFTLVLFLYMSHKLKGKGGSKMTTMKKVKGTAISMPVGIVMGVALSALLTCGLAAVVTWLALEGKIEAEEVGYISLVMIVLSSMLGALLSAVKTKRRWMLVCFITGIAYYLTLLCITAIFFGGNYRGCGVTAMLVLIGSVCAGMLGLMKRRFRGSGYKKYHTC